MILTVDRVGKRLGGRPVLADVSFTCGDGEVVVLRGENGAGKSTLLRVIAGIHPPDGGRVTLDGQPVRGPGGATLRALGYLPDAATALPELTVAELVDLVAALKGVARGGTAPDAWGLAELWQRRLSALSLGQRRRACLAAALVGDPWLLLLDEPTEGLDALGVEGLAQVLRARSAAGQATLVATHDARLEQTPGARVVWLHAGRMVENQER